MSDEADIAYICEPLRGHARLIGELICDPSNARTHGERNLETIRGSLQKFGQQKPIVLAEDGKTVIAGNGTLLAARALGWSHIAAVTSPLAGADATAYGIADNRTGELADWDRDALASLLSAMDDDMQEAAGFEPDDLKALLSEGQNGRGEDQGGQVVCPNCGEPFTPG